jgi:chromosome segregation ATPase
MSEAGQVSATAPAESPSREIPDQVQTALSELLFTLKGEERDECNALIVERMHLNKTCRAFIEGYSSRAREKLVEEHESLKRECVAQEARISALKTKIIELEQDCLRKNNTVTNAMIGLSDAEQARKVMSRFASASEIKKAEAAIATARTKFEEASNNAAPIREEINRLVFTDLPRLGEELQQLSAEELRLRAAVTGQGFTDEEFGIQVPGRA